jgi:hypothetical protein
VIFEKYDIIILNMKMIKKLFKINHFILAILLFCLISSALYLKSKNNEGDFYIKTVENRYNLYSVNDTYIISSFEGSGGYLYGGIVSKNKIDDINTITMDEISQLIQNNLDYTFPSYSFPDNGGLYIGNFDFDKNIELFAFEFLDTTFLHPIEISPDGKINEEKFSTRAFIFLPVLFFTLPAFILYILFFVYYFIVCIIYVIVHLKKKRNV